MSNFGICRDSISCWSEISCWMSAPFMNNHEPVMRFANAFSDDSTISTEGAGFVALSVLAPRLSWQISHDKSVNHASIIFNRCQVISMTSFLEHRQHAPLRWALHRAQAHCSWHISPRTGLATHRPTYPTCANMCNRKNPSLTYSNYIKPH